MIISPSDINQNNPEYKGHSQPTTSKSEEEAPTAFKHRGGIANTVKIESYTP